MSDLGIDLRNIESLTDNVRGWVFQLIASDSETAHANREYIAAGVNDQVRQVRDGLAKGLRGIYFGGLEQIIFDWFTNEYEDSVRQRILEHMTAQGDRCPAYLPAVEEAYRNSSSGSVARARLEAAAIGTSIYAKFQRINYEGMGPTFFDDHHSGGKTVININSGGGTVSVGAIAADGSTISATTISAVNSASGEGGEALRAVLAFLKDHLIDPASRAEGDHLIKEAAEKPSRSTVGKLLDWLKVAKDTNEVGTSIASSAALLIPKVIAWLHGIPA